MLVVETETVKNVTAVKGNSRKVPQLPWQSVYSLLFSVCCVLSKHTHCIQVSQCLSRSSVPL